MTCPADPAHVWPQKDPSEKLDYGVDFERFLTRFWEKDKSYSAGTVLRPNRPIGFELECTTAGRSGNREPTNWPTTPGATLTEGSVTWTCRMLSTSSLQAVVSDTPTWSADAGVTVSGESINGQQAAAFIEGGSDGEDYSVLVTAELSDGRQVSRVCILPVRRAVRRCSV